MTCQVFLCKDETTRSHISEEICKKSIFATASSSNVSKTTGGPGQSREKMTTPPALGPSSCAPSVNSRVTRRHVGLTRLGRRWSKSEHNSRNPDSADCTPVGERSMASTTLHKCRNTPAPTRLNTFDLAKRKWLRSLRATCGSMEPCAKTSPITSLMARNADVRVAGSFLAGFKPTHISVAWAKAHRRQSPSFGPMEQDRHAANCRGLRHTVPPARVTENTWYLKVCISMQTILTTISKPPNKTY